MEVAHAQLRVADIYQDLGRYDDAEAAYRQALAAHERLAEQFPGEVNHRQDLAATLLNFGRFWRVAHRDPQAEELLVRAADLLGDLLREQPDRPRSIATYRDTLRALCQVFIQSHQFAKAEPVMDRYARAPGRPDTGSFGVTRRICANWPGRCSCERNSKERGADRGPPLVAFVRPSMSSSPWSATGRVRRRIPNCSRHCISTPVRLASRSLARPPRPSRRSRNRCDCGSNLLANTHSCPRIVFHWQTPAVSERIHCDYSTDQPTLKIRTSKRSPS